MDCLELMATKNKEHPHGKEGHIEDRAFMIVLLRDKQGVWMIADID